MEHSPFDKLSAELRNRIWECTVTTDPNPLFLGTDHGKQPAISRVCSRIRNETLLMFYANNDFAVEIDANVTPTGELGGFYEQTHANLKGMNRWLDLLEQSIHSSVKSLTINVNLVGGFRFETLSKPEEWQRLVVLLKKRGYVAPRLYLVLCLPKWASSRCFNRSPHEVVEWALEVGTMLYDCGLEFDSVPQYAG